MEANTRLVCPKCSEEIISTFSEHYSTYCLQKDSVSKISEKVAAFCDQTYICGRCLMVFGKVQWNYHQKKIRKQCSGFRSEDSRVFTPLKSLIDNEDQLSERFNTQSSQIRSLSQIKPKSVEKREISSVPQSRLFSTSLFSDRHTQSELISYKKVITEEQTILLHLLNLLDAKSKIPLLHWIKKNKKIKSIYLQEFFQRFLQKMFQRLWEVIEVPSFNMLQLNAPLKWNKILKDPQDIFNQQLVIESIKELPARKRNRVLSTLNRIYKKFYSDIFPKFHIQAIIPIKKRTGHSLRTKDLFTVLEKLMETRQRDFVHIAIDFYLIFQSSQRMFSDRQNITQGVLKLLQDRKTDRQACELQMDINKTKDKEIKFILSEQLCQLLELFQWKGFYNLELYSRMSKIFGFPAYSIKRCMFSQTELQKAKNANINLQNLANHKSLEVALIYAKDGAQTNEKNLKDNLRIPNLKVCWISRTDLEKVLAPRLHFRKRYATINNNWLDLLREWLGQYDSSYCDFYDSQKIAITSSASQASAQQIQVQVPLIINQAKISHKQAITEVKEKHPKIQKDSITTVQIEGLQYSFKNSKFDFKQLFLNTKIRYCQFCGLQFDQKKIQGYVCIYCTGQFHKHCLPTFCDCVSQPFYFPQKGVPSNCQKQNKNLKLKMPQEYLGSKNQDKLNQVIFLLAARKFRFTTSAFYQGNMTIDEELIKRLNLQKIVLQRFEDYQRGHYFPPLILKASGFQTTSGTGFGLVAAEDIPKDCFIGQYAADILPAFDAIHFKRVDSVFNLVEGKPNNTLLIGPFKRCGYACLINGAKPQQANCASLKVEINGFIRLIIFTSKKIAKGTELCYNYAKDSIFTKKDLNLNKQTTQKYQRCGLINLGSTCYANSVFQFLNILVGEHISKGEYLFTLFQQLQKNQSVYSPKRQIQSVFSNINLPTEDEIFHFSENKQADAHEFLVKLLDKMCDKVKDKVTGIIKSKIKCNKCGTESENSQIFATLEVQMARSLIFSNILKQSNEENVQYDCLSCSQKNHNNKKTQIVHFPQILIISLKRFNSNFKKIKSVVKEINSFQRYELQAVIVHKGSSITSGHYITEDYREDQVYIFDDQKVQKELKNTSQSYGYIFGYKIKNQQ